MRITGLSRGSRDADAAARGVLFFTVFVDLVFLVAIGIG